MKYEEQEEIFNKTVEEMRTIMFRKGNDYANADRLSNFKLAGTICGLDAERNCLSLIATKVARLGVLLGSTGEPNNESIEDSILDLANYAVLLRMILIDKRPRTRVASLGDIGYTAANTDDNKITPEYMQQIGNLVNKYGR